MFPVDRLLLIAAALVIIGIFSSKFSARLGLPVLVLFVGVGMLAGSDGIGGIAFENYALAHGVGTVALAIILFDGGLRTSTAAFRVALRPAFALATAGVMMTTGVVALAGMWLLGLPPLSALLLGSIIGSTDAAAVFSVLRTSGIHVRKRIASILEVESGANDPMAVFLTVACIQLITGQREPGAGLLLMFVLQMGIGAVTGVLVGRVALWAINRARLEAAGLYPLITSAAGLLAYGAAASIGGSGFLAVYVAGIIIGNAELIFRRGTLLFNDAAAWLAQIVMFVLLGLLAFPSRLDEVFTSGIIISMVLIFVARPFAVGAILLPFGINLREIAFISWAGLKGAVPIVLATYPLMFGVPLGDTLFDLVFFVVLLSAVLQGWSLPWVARRLGLQLPAKPATPVSLEITSLRDVDGDIVEYTLDGRSRAAGRTLRDLKLPENVVVAMVVRDQKIIPPRGSTRLLDGDHVFVVMHSRTRGIIDRVFGAGNTPVPAAVETPEFPLNAQAATLQDLADLYGVVVEGAAEQTLSQLAAERGAVDVGDELDLGVVVLRVHSTVDGEVLEVGLRIR